jgi:hypothetical protein
MTAPELTGRHRGSAREIAQNRVVGPAWTRLERFRADQNLCVLAELVGDLDHRHQAGIHADEIHRPPEQLVGAGHHALQLEVVEAITGALVVGDPAGLGVRGQLLARGSETRPADAAGPAMVLGRDGHLWRHPEA